MVIVYPHWVRESPSCLDIAPLSIPLPRAANDPLFQDNHKKDFAYSYSWVYSMSKL